MVVRKVGKYEVGRTIGEGTFAKVKFAQNTETGESVAMKVLDRTTIIKHKMVDQIKREISIMKLVRHPNVVRLHEAWAQNLEYKLYFVLASRTKIYIILEFITGGELFDKIVHHGRLSEAESRRYFQQLIDGVDYCHSKGVYHRDLKPENLLLDSQENLKISDFGLSALPGEGISLLRTTCGTPNYVAPEVLSHKGYDGALADVWSCGVILYVLIAGYLPFDEMDLTTLYSKAWNCIDRAEFSCPTWFPVGAKSLIHRILDPNPETRIRIEEIRNDEWFKRSYVPVRLLEYEDVNLDDVNAVFDDTEEERFEERCRDEDAGPLVLNAFDLIILSQGLNLSAMFDRGQDSVKHQTRFVSQKPAKVVLSSMEVVAQSMGFKTHIRNFKMRVEGLSANKTSHFSVILEIFQVAPTFIMVDIQRAAGDAAEYLKVGRSNLFLILLLKLEFYNNFCNNLEDIIWKPANDVCKSRISKTKSKRR
nr:CIPK12 [Lonicera japonica]